MPAIVSFVGKSNIGKTTYLEKVVAEIKRRGYRVAVIKHDVHGFEMDRPGKDSWRMTQAGADVVSVSSPQKAAIIFTVDHDLDPDELAALLPTVDIIITEGYKRGSKPKVEVSRREVSDSLLCDPSELVAIASDQQFPIDVPHFSLDEPAGLVDLLVERFIAPAQEDVSLTVDGQVIPLKEFARAMLAGTVRGAISSLNGVKDPGDITLRLRSR